MRRPTKAFEMEGVRYSVRQLPPLDALELVPEVARLFGPAIERLLGDGIKIGERVFSILDFADGEVPPEAINAIVRSVIGSLGRQSGTDLRSLACSCARGASINDIKIDTDEAEDRIAQILNDNVPSVIALGTIVWHQVVLIALPPSADGAT